MTSAVLHSPIQWATACPKAVSFPDCDGLQDDRYHAASVIEQALECLFQFVGVMFVTAWKLPYALVCLLPIAYIYARVRSV